MQGSFILRESLNNILCNYLPNFLIIKPFNKRIQYLIQAIVKLSGEYDTDNLSSKEPKKYGYLDNINNLTIEGFKQIILALNQLTRNGEINKYSFRIGSYYLKSSLTIFDQGHGSEEKFGDSLEEFLFAIYEFEKDRTGIDYLEEGEDSFSQEEESEIGKLGIEPMDIFTVEEVSEEHSEDSIPTKNTPSKDDKSGCHNAKKSLNLIQKIERNIIFRKYGGLVKAFHVRHYSLKLKEKVETSTSEKTKESKEHEQDNNLISKSNILLEQEGKHESDIQIEDFKAYKKNLLLFGHSGKKQESRNKSRITQKSLDINNVCSFAKVLNLQKTKPEKFPIIVEEKIQKSIKPNKALNNGNGKIALNSKKTTDFAKNKTKNKVQKKLIKIETAFILDAGLMKYKNESKADSPKKNNQKLLKMCLSDRKRISNPSTKITQRFYSPRHMKSKQMSPKIKKNILSAGMIDFGHHNSLSISKNRHKTKNNRKMSRTKSKNKNNTMIEVLIKNLSQNYSNRNPRKKSSCKLSSTERKREHSFSKSKSIERKRSPLPMPITELSNKRNYKQDKVEEYTVNPKLDDLSFVKQVKRNLIKLKETNKALDNCLILHKEMRPFTERNRSILFDNKGRRSKQYSKTHRNVQEKRKLSNIKVIEEEAKQKMNTSKFRQKNDQSFIKFKKKKNKTNYLKNKNPSKLNNPRRFFKGEALFQTCLDSSSSELK